MIRWQTPLAYMRRTATADTELGGKLIRGRQVVMWYISGEPRRGYLRGARRLHHRSVRPRNHMSFGFGIHRCLGLRVAEMQLRIIWEEILKRFRLSKWWANPRASTRVL